MIVLRSHRSDTPAKLMDVDQMTSNRVEKYGGVIFTVCKKFGEKRMAYLADKQAAEMMAKEEDFAEDMPEPSSSSSGSNNVWLSKP